MSSREDTKSVFTFASGSSTSKHEIDITKEKVEILAERGKFFFATISLGIVAAIIAISIRSSVIISDITVKYNALAHAEQQLDHIRVIELMIFGLEKEAFARVKYLTSGLDPIHYTELQTALVEWDELFDKNVAVFQTITFKAPEYRRYNCNYYQIRSNLEKRSEAIPIRQHRGYDERTMDPWRDGDYYECLLTLLADIQAQLITKSTGLDYIWQEVVSYYLTLRTYVNMIVAINYAHLTRKLVLDQGSVQFARKEDAQNLDDAAAIAMLLLDKACRWYAEEVTSCTSAYDDLDKLLIAFNEIKNATKALLLVSNDKFELTNLAKGMMENVVKTKEIFWADIKGIHKSAIDASIGALVGEGIKIFVALFLLTTLLALCVIHMKNESVRIRNRHVESIDRYQNACKAVYRLLPEPVAKQLAIGANIKPEFFHATSVMVSDIVGFTSICSKLTAIEVLAMLNRVYTLFDTQTNANRCYKIETVGDAYIVAAGVPVRDASHASKVAKLAITLVEGIRMITLPRNIAKIRIRVGICSGPVIAGVVGVKMLRYCLFGRTVLQANRMEQTSIAQRIQLSETTANELNLYGGFVIVPRNSSEWPDGRPTWWLDCQIDSDLTYALYNGSNAALKAQIIG